MLFTSTWDEPYGLTLAESLACGTPVIGFDVGASAEIVTPSTGIIVAKEDKEAFIKAFSEIKHISRQACRERALQFCSVSAMVEGYLALYKAAVRERQAKKSFDNSRNEHLAQSSFTRNHKLNSSTSSNLKLNHTSSDRSIIMNLEDH